MVNKQKETAELVEEILALDRIRKPGWFPHQEGAQRRWIVEMIDERIPKALDLSFDDAARGDDWMCFTSARIAANYALMLRPDLREPRSWDAPIAMQWRGVKPQQWYPGYTWTETEAYNDAVKHVLKMAESRWSEREGNENHD